MPSFISSIFVVIPAFNEEESIGQVLSTLCDKEYSVVVVDDGSTDDTWSIVRCFPALGIRHVVNLGQGAALQTGMNFAIRQRAKIIVHFDADGQHCADEISHLIEPILRNEADVVFGSRFLREEDRLQIPIKKRLLLRVATVVNGLLTGVWLSDAHNGMRALNLEAARKVTIKENGYAHASEILLRVRDAGLRFTEVPTQVAYTEYSMAKGQPLWNSINIAVDVLLRRILQ